MSDTKLSALTELATAPANGDELYINDGGVSKKISVANLLSGVLAKSTFNEHCIVRSIADNTPGAVNIDEDRIVGRASGGYIGALTPAQVNTILGQRVHKFDATVAPDADNDVDENYEPGSFWVDVTADKAYVCLDNTDGAAIWLEITQVVDQIRTWTTVQRALETALTDGTVAVDMDTGQNFTLLLEENSTLAAPSNLAAGQSGLFIITQDGTGNWTLGFNAAYKFVGGSAPTITATAGAIDILPYYCDGSNVFILPALLDIKAA